MIDNERLGFMYGTTSIVDVVRVMHETIERTDTETNARAEFGSHCHKPRRRGVLNAIVSLFSIRTKGLASVAAADQLA